MKEMSVRDENNKRLETLYKQSHDWLLAVAINIAKDRDTAEELVQELYLYLADKPNPKIWFLTSFNLKYLYLYIKSRFINRVKISNRTQSISEDYDEIEVEYDYEFDEKIHKAYDDMVNELKTLENTPMWVSSKLTQMYYFEGFTQESLAQEINICKSTVFLHTKKMKNHIKETIPNPFTK
jgi:RNA polymerase sigma factor (sigma-70 family)